MSVASRVSAATVAFVVPAKDAACLPRRVGSIRAAAGGEWMEAALDATRAPQVGLAGAPYRAPADGARVQRACDPLHHRAAPGRAEAAR